MPNSDVEKPPDSVELTTSAFTIDQRVHFAGDSRRIGTVKYVGPVEGYSGLWVGVDWDDGEGKHDGSVNGVCYFHAKTPKSASFVRPHNISAGVTVLEALELRYKGTSTKEEEDEMYVLSASNRRVSVQLLGKDKIQDKLSKFEELEGVSLSYLGVSSPGVPGQIGSVLLSLRHLDLTGNLLSDWKSIASICEQLPMLSALNLSHNKLSYDVTGLPMLKNLRIVVLNHTGQWTQVEVLKHSLPALEELHLMGNELREITPPTSKLVQGFDSLRLLNLEDNLFEDWAEISKLSQLRSLEQLQLNNNNLKDIAYPDHDMMRTPLSGQEQLKQGDKPFQHLCCLLLGGNNINDISAVDSLNYFPNLVDIRLSDNPVADPGKGGVPRFVLIARLAKVQMLNGSEVSPRERKESEIRYIRLVMSKSSNLKEIQQMHPRFAELKVHHGIEDERPSSTGAAGPQKMASGLLSVTLKCVGASIGEKPPLTKKLPATTTVGKLKLLCESFFKLKSFRPRLFLQEEGNPLPILLEDEMASLLDVGVSNGSTILVDEES